MSFSDLKKNSKSSFSKLQKSLEKGSRFAKPEWEQHLWTLPRDKAGNGYAVIRFLPTTDGDDLPYTTLCRYAFQGPGGWYIENALSTPTAEHPRGKEDPCGEYISELYRSGDESLIAEAGKMRRQTSFYSNIYIIKDPVNPENEGTVRLFRYGKKIKEMIESAVSGNQLEGREGINPYDFWQGADFKLRAKKVSGYPNYDSSEFMEPSVLDDLDDDQLESIWKRQISLRQIAAPDQFKTYEELEKRLNRVLGRKGASAESTQAPAREEAPAPRKEVDVTSKPSFAKKEEPVAESASSVDDSDIDDVMKYFEEKLKEED